MANTSATTCGKCSAPLAPNALFCSQCGQPIPKTEPAPVAKTPDEPAASDGEIVWSKDVRTNRFIVYDLFKGFGIAFLIFGLILLGIMVFTDNLDSLLQMLQVMGWIAVGFTVLIAFVVLVFFGNHFPMRFTVTKKGVMMESLSRRAHVTNRIAIIVGLLARKPGVAGAGLIAASQEAMGYDWDEIWRATYYPSEHSITLLNTWRVVLRLFCTKENYEEVAAAVRAGLESGERKRGRRRKGSASSPKSRR